VNDEKHHSWCDLSKGVPSLLIFERIVAFCQSAGIVENKDGSLESKPMLEQILAVLLVVLFETHDCSAVTISVGRTS
jgi:hypothetical protein